MKQAKIVVICPCNRGTTCRRFCVIQTCAHGYNQHKVTNLVVIIEISDQFTKTTTRQMKALWESNTYCKCLVMIYVFLEMKLSSLDYMHLWAIYILPGSVCLFCCSQIGTPILGTLNRSQTHECRNWEQAAQFHLWEHINRIFGIGTVHGANRVIHPNVKQLVLTFNKKKQSVKTELR